MACILIKSVQHYLCTDAKLVFLQPSMLKKKRFYNFNLCATGLHFKFISLAMLFYRCKISISTAVNANVRPGQSISENIFTTLKLCRNAKKILITNTQA